MKKDIAPKKKVAPKVAPKEGSLRQHAKMDMDVDGIIARIKEIEGVGTDKAVAELLEMTPQALSNAIRKGRISLDVIGVYISRKNISFDWLITGRKEGLPIEFQGIGEDSPIYKVVKTMKAMPRSKWSLVRDIIKRLSEEDS